MVIMGIRMIRAFLFLTIVGTALARVPTAERVVGGQPASIEQYPFMANLIYLHISSGAYVQGCAASILNNWNLLCAAHCFSVEEVSHVSVWRIRVGSSYPNNGGTVVNAQRFILHEEFEVPTPLNNDVAVIRLAAPLVFTQGVASVSIPGPHYQLPIDTPLNVMGWGRLIFGGPFPDQLQVAEIYVIDQQLCYERYEFLRDIPAYAHFPAVTDKMICAGIVNRGMIDSCTGDSGGPVVHNGNVAIGIVSWGYGCADPWYPGVNVRVSSFTDWIVAAAYS